MICLFFPPINFIYQMCVKKDTYSSNHSLCKSRSNCDKFAFKYWMHHFGTKLFDCKLYPGGTNARRRPNALAFKNKRQSGCTSQKRKNIRNIQEWNGKNVIISSTRTLRNSHTHAHKCARI